MVDLNRSCVVPARFADHWWWVQPAISASPSTVDALARLADALVTVTTVLEAVEAAPLEEMSTLITVPPRHRRLVSPKIPHLLYSRKSIHTTRTYSPSVNLEYIRETGNEVVERHLLSSQGVGEIGASLLE